MKTWIVGGGGGGDTVTLRVAVAGRPAPAWTVGTSCGAPRDPAVSQLNVMVVAVPDPPKSTTVPFGGRRGSSTLTVHVSVPLTLVADTETLTTPPTVAPSAGVLNVSPGGGGATTVTWRVAVAVRPPPSCTVSVSV